MVVAKLPANLEVVGHSSLSVIPSKWRYSIAMPMKNDLDKIATIIIIKARMAPMGLKINICQFDDWDVVRGVRRF